jgi:FkbM family methyltransferase
MKSLPAFAAGAGAVAILIVAACSPQPNDSQTFASTSLDREQIAACGPPTAGLKTRKERIAKGVFYAGRRRSVDGNLERWDTIYGPFWVVEGNFRTFAEVLAEQAVEVYGDQTRGVRPGDIVFDGGAHFGGFTRTALNRGARLVVAVDIAPENIEVLKRNFASAIAAQRVVVVDQGLWDAQTTMTLERKNNTWADQVSAQGTGPTITMTTIDRLVADLKLEKVDFIKLDIEGAEWNALAGAVDTMRKHRPRMAIAAYHKSDDVDLLSRAVRTAQPAYEVCVNNGELGHGYSTLLFK